MANDSGKADGLRGETLRFSFQAARERIFRSVFIGSAVLPLLAAVGSWTGHVKDPDRTYWLVVFGCALGAGLLVALRLLALTQKAALKLGSIELDDTQIRWKRSDQSLVFEAAWDDFARGTLDRAHHQILLHRKDKSPILLSRSLGNVDVERFDELQAFVAKRVELDIHGKNVDSASANRVIKSGLSVCLASAALYGANVGIAPLLHWSRMLMLIPLVMAAVGAWILVSGIQIARGKGPLVSNLYNPAYPRTLVRFFVTAVIANVVALWAMNGVR